jgi:hypothetical protein
MTMTRKDYIKLASSIKDTRRGESAIRVGEQRTWTLNGIDSVARDLCRVLEWDNPRFDRAKFLAACGVGN